VTPRSWRAWAAGLVLVMAIIVCVGGGPLRADTPPTDTPAAAPTLAATAAPTALPSGLSSGVTTGQWTFAEPPLASWLDSLISTIFTGFSRIINGSVAAAQWLFLILSAITILWAGVRWMLSTTPLEEVVADAYQRLVRAALMYALIGCAFVGPGGSGMGWFPAIVNGIIAFAQGASGVSVITSSTSFLSTSGSTSPGTLILSGYTPGDVLTMFWNIATFILASAFNGQSVTNLLTGAFTGATGLWIVTALIAAASALGVLWLGCRVAFKYFLTLFKAYTIASQAYLMGFLGMESTSTLGTGIFNAAINLGIETGVLIIVVGVFKTFLYLAVTAMNAGLDLTHTLVGNASTLSPLVGGMAQVVEQNADAGVRLVCVLMLDALVVLFYYAVEQVPESAAHALSGRLDVRVGEFMSRMASGSGAVKIGGLAAGAGAGLAGGAMAAKALGTGAALAGSGAGGGAAPMASRLKAALTGAAQGGFMTGGPAGAIGGALQAFSASGGSGGSGGGAVGSVSGRGSKGQKFANAEFSPKGDHGSSSTSTGEGGRESSPDAGAGPQTSSNGSSRNAGQGGARVVDGEAGGMRGSDPRPRTTGSPDVAPGESSSVNAPDGEVRVTGGGSRVVDARTVGGGGGGGATSSAAGGGRSSGADRASTAGGGTSSGGGGNADSGAGDDGNASGAPAGGGSTATAGGGNATNRQTTGRQQQGGGGSSPHNTAHNGPPSGGQEGGGGQNGGAFAGAMGGMTMQNMMQMQMYRQLLGLSGGLNPKRPPLDNIEHPGAQINMAGLHK
jgi:hypothetical protein